MSALRYPNLSNRPTTYYQCSKRMSLLWQLQSSAQLGLYYRLQLPMQFRILSEWIHMYSLHEIDLFQWTIYSELHSECRCIMSDLPCHLSVGTVHCQQLFYIQKSELYCMCTDHNIQWGDWSRVCNSVQFKLCSGQQDLHRLCTSYWTMPWRIQKCGV